MYLPTNQHEHQDDGQNELDDEEEHGCASDPTIFRIRNEEAQDQSKEYEAVCDEVEDFQTLRIEAVFDRAWAH